jgi:peptidoglycan/LPS O-acetylase OafA/YrhL
MAPVPQAVLVIGLALVLAELSWRFVETPAQRRMDRRRQARAEPASPPGTGALTLAPEPIT